MSSETLEQRLAEAEAEYARAIIAYREAQEAATRMTAAWNAAGAAVSALRAEQKWGLRVGDIVEWDVGAYNDMSYASYRPKLVTRPAHVAAMKVTQIGSHTIGGLMLKKDGTVGLKEHTEWGGFDPKYHRIRKEPAT
jgi:hypothetical protein